MNEPKPTDSAARRALRKAVAVFVAVLLNAVMSAVLTTLLDALELPSSPRALLRSVAGLRADSSHCLAPAPQAVAATMRAAGSSAFATAASLLQRWRGGCPGGFDEART